MTQKVSKSVELEKKVQDLEQKLKVAYSKSEEQVSRDMLMKYIGYLISDHLLLATNHMIICMQQYIGYLISDHLLSS